MTDGTTDELRDRSVGDLMKQLAQETSTLVRQEIQLARAEMTEKGKKAGIGLGMFGAAGVVALLALGALTAFFILALDGVMPNWAAALVVALVYGVIAGILALMGRERVEEAGTPVPEQTVETVKEDVEWAKSQVRSDER